MAVYNEKQLSHESLFCLTVMSTYALNFLGPGVHFFQACLVCFLAYFANTQHSLFL